ncbi:hypothetical protein ABMB67_004403 [Halalkalibacter oceani]
MDKCETCKLNEIVSGCGKPIKDMEIVKGIGVVECKHYEKNTD